MIFLPTVYNSLLKAVYWTMLGLYCSCNLNQSTTNHMFHTVSECDFLTAYVWWLWKSPINKSHIPSQWALSQIGICAAGEILIVLRILSRQCNEVPVGNTYMKNEMHLPNRIHQQYQKTQRRHKLSKSGGRDSNNVSLLFVMSDSWRQNFKNKHFNLQWI